jgi:hypothetical protein
MDKDLMASRLQRGAYGEVGIFDKSGSREFGMKREHMARLGWHILVSRAQWTRPEEVDSSRIEGVDSFWIVEWRSQGLGLQMGAGDL